MPGPIAYKSVAFEIKARGDDGWSFSGYASTFGTLDQGGDVVLPGAFSHSLTHRNPKFLWQHDTSEPLGRVTGLREDGFGLFGDFLISKTSRGRDAYELLKDGALDSMSIGYVAEDQEFDEKTGIRQLKAVTLFEISLVSIPMNEEARITAVKAAPIAPAPLTPGPSITAMRLNILRKELQRAGLLEIR